MCSTAADSGATYSFHKAFQCGILQHQRIKHLLCLLADVQQNYAGGKHGRDKILLHWKKKNRCKQKYRNENKLNPDIASEMMRRTKIQPLALISVSHV